MPSPVAPDDAPEPIFVGVQRFAYRLGLSTSTVYAMLDSGQIRSVRFGTRRLIPVEEEARMADELTARVG